MAKEKDTRLKQAILAALEDNKWSEDSLSLLNSHFQSLSAEYFDFYIGAVLNLEHLDITLLPRTYFLDILRNEHVIFILNKDIIKSLCDFYANTTPPTELPEICKQLVEEPQAFDEGDHPPQVFTFTDDEQVPLLYEHNVSPSWCTIL